MKIKKDTFKDKLICNRKKSHYFLSLNRFARPHRIMLAYWLYKNLKKPAHISCRLANLENYNNFWHTLEGYNDLNYKFYSGRLNEEETYMKFADTLPWQLDHKSKDRSTLPSLKQDIFPAKYVYDSACYIATETHFIASNDEYKGFLSEKTFKGFIWGLPSLYIGPPYMIESIKLLGYQSFTGLINEDYDNETNYVKRLEMIFDEIDRIQNIKNISKWYYEGIEIYKHNFKVINEYMDRDTAQIIEDYHNLNYLQTTTSYSSI